MDWHQIIYFQSVANVQHITRAAKQLSISQPALSRSISKLEDELGVQLFDRKGRNIYLNRYGKMFLSRVEQSIKQIEIGKQEIWDDIHPDKGTISLSFLPSLGISLVPDLLSSYQQEHPNVKFQLSQASNRQILDQLKQRKTDLALISLYHEDEEIQCQPLITEELFVIVSIDHPLASYHEIDLNMVRDEPFISFKDVNELQTIILELCKEAGFSPNVVFEGEDIGTVAGLVGAKLGVSLVPKLKVLDKTKIKLIRVTNPICKREIGVAWLKDSYISPVVERFVQYIQHFF
ncbi:LysR family transcriptional regulator [Pullulanibacillus sp. KACC 23026]|uniref:LysR family transcriptional regulator n=1 Tax=Pullulanibacillus sp. KACC 23026 TaxID=3028315 RepID=UPI0023B00B23|nr:LysR family transcriptional regulator [Pullulanibacillus sp. KACC 23026]WEG14690.1 LysR family transcriptional regulator [Pullulanibacillus sp. KACC 23026]